MCSYSVVMDEVTRQNDSTLKSFIYNLREGKMDERSTYFLLRRYIYKICPEEQKRFESTDMCLILTWDQTRRITLNYLKKF